MKVLLTVLIWISFDTHSVKIILTKIQALYTVMNNLFICIEVVILFITFSVMKA